MRRSKSDNDNCAVSAADLLKATVVPQRDGADNRLGRARVRVQVVVRDKNHLRNQLVALLVLAPAVAGCSGASDMFSSDLLSKDAEWFSRPGRLFISNVSIDTPPLTPNKPIAPDDLVSAEGGCSGMPPPAGPADANALTDGAAGAPPAPTGTVALGHTECDVVRGIGAPTASISPTMGAATGSRWSTGCAAPAPESTASPPGG